MTKPDPSLMKIYEGWEGHQTSLLHAIAPLTPDQLRWRPVDQFHSVGEVARHISLGRLTWFLRMNAPGSAALAEKIDGWEKDEDDNRYIVESTLPIAETAVDLVYWLEITGKMVADTLQTWHVSDLTQTYRHTWNGDVYAISRQWTIWRILSHDIHHGGQIALMLGMQGIEVFELGDLFGRSAIIL